MTACQNGDQDAFGHLYDHFVDAIYRYVYFRVRQTEAEDLTEAVFVKAWENITQYKQGQFRFSSWLFRIAHNVVVDHYRTNRSVEELVEEYKDERTERHPISQTEVKLTNTMLRGSIAELKQIYQHVLVLKFFDDFSNAEVAEILGKSEGSLRILQFRALRALKKVLQTRGIDTFEADFHRNR